MRFIETEDGQIAMETIVGAYISKLVYNDTIIFKINLLCLDGVHTFYGVPYP